VPSICVNCHKPDTQAFAARHMNYPVGKADCTSCHDPHGSNQPALLLNNVHAPVGNRTCDACHEAPTSATPFATKRPGFELCRGCHSEMVNTTLAKGRLHWPVADKRGCVSCHNPHAAKHDKLLVASGADLCGRCHADTLKRIAATPVGHKPVAEGACTACHSPHGANGTYLVDQPSIIAACATCHDYQQHSAHPIGDEAVDPRNKNLRIDCLSCHKGHGTEFKWMLLSATSKELCTAATRDSRGDAMKRVSFACLVAAALVFGHLRLTAAEAARLRYLASVYFDDKEAGFKLPEGVACGDQGRLVVADTGNGRLVRFSYRDQTAGGGREIKVAQLSAPSRIQLNSKGEIYALDGKQRRIVHLGPEGEFKAVLAYDGVPPPATIVPKAFAIGPADSIYVLDVSVPASWC